MREASFRGISEKNTKYTFFLFFSLLIFSAGFFVFASDATSTKNIFQDSDQDGLSNDEEKLYGTDPFNKDTDHDSYGDSIEVESGYDPLKPAPGDKIIKENKISSVTTMGVKENLTQKVSGEIAGILKNTNGNDQTISMEEMNASVEKILNGNTEEMTLPKVDMKDVKTKKLSKNLKGENRIEAEKKDVMEYLTRMSYIVANNSPQAFHNKEDLGKIMNSLSSDSISALALGDVQHFDQLSEKGAKMLEEVKAVEVPETMLDVHVKAMKMAMYMMQMKDTVQSLNTEDPLGQIAKFSQVQGFLGAALSFEQDVQQKLTDLKIPPEIPLDL